MAARQTLVAIAFVNLIWLGWLQGVLWLGVSIGCLSSMGAYAPNSPSSLTQLRLLSFIGLVVTSGTIISWTGTKLAVVAILLIPAAFFFIVLIFRPILARKSRNLRIYLTACVTSTILTICVSYISMILTQ
jgi:hypothetical protein